MMVFSADFFLSSSILYQLCQCPLARASSGHSKSRCSSVSMALWHSGHEAGPSMCLLTIPVAIHECPVNRFIFVTVASLAMRLYLLAVQKFHGGMNVSSSESTCFSHHMLGSLCTASHTSIAMSRSIASRQALCQLPVVGRTLWLSRLSSLVTLGNSSYCRIFSQYWTRLVARSAFTAPCSRTYMVGLCSLAAFSKNPIYRRAIFFTNDLYGGAPIIASLLVRACMA